MCTVIMKWSTRTKQSRTIFINSFNWINVTSSRLLSHSKLNVKCNEEETKQSHHHQQQQYFVPKDVAKLYQKLRRGDLIREYPNMKPEDWTWLNSSNYLTRFQLSLWFEEMETEKLLRNYDQHDILLEIFGQHHVFNVPGLVHFQPSIFEGTRVKCYLPQLDTTFKGVIAQITTLERQSLDFLQVSQVWVKFIDEFSQIYNEGPPVPVSIEFCVSRGVLKKQHLAINKAVELLDGKFLFPTKSLKRKPPKINFTEDPLDNTRSPSDLKSLQKSMQTSPKKLRKMDKVRKYSKLLTFLDRTEGIGDDSSDGLKMGKLKWFNPSLNKEQKNAIEMILKGHCRPLPYIIFGPPGTGKTATIIEAIKQIYYLESTSRILVTVPSNAGADLIAGHLITSNLFTPTELVRFNGFSRMESEIPESIKDFCRTGECLDSIVQRRLIICTASTAGQFLTEMESRNGPDLNFSHIFLDEAGTCTEPEAMIPVVLAGASKADAVIVLAGDPKQLGPVVLCRHRVTNLLDTPLIERLMESTKIYKRNEEKFPHTKYNPMVLTKLVQSYRSHEMLLKVPSTLFYEDELVSGESSGIDDEQQDICKNLDFLPRKGVPLVFHGVQGTCFKHSHSFSRYNLEEVSQVMSYVRKLTDSGISSEQIGIITPYRAQVQKLRLALSSHFRVHSLEQLPKVASVQEFQGGERTIIIISTVRSSIDFDHSMDDHDGVDDDDNYKVNLGHKLNDRLGFIFSSKRFNVAITRAKGLLIIVGDPCILCQNHYWNSLLEYCLSLNVYVGCELPESREK